MGLLSLFSNKQKKRVLREPHCERFAIEYGILPSAAEYAPWQFFTPEFDGDNLLLGAYDDLKENEWVKRYSDNLRMKIYKVEGGQISVLKFPEPEASPELAYAAVPMPDHIMKNSADETGLEYRPYYILAKMVDKWCIGEIKTDKDSGSYYPVYYKMTEQLDPIGFVEWVMEREGFSKLPTQQEDPVANFFGNQ